MKHIVNCGQSVSGQRPAKGADGLPDAHGARPSGHRLAGVCAQVLSAGGHPGTTVGAGGAGRRLIIVMGGDGTILHVAATLRDHPIPIIGVNFGGKGFLAGLEDDELDILLEIADGKYTISRRMMLDVELVRNERIICTQSVLNDVVIHGGHVDCIGVTAYGDGVPITRFNGDGIIVATPTGSTAYSMSAGGPLVEPENENIIMTPSARTVWPESPLCLRPGGRSRSCRSGSTTGRPFSWQMAGTALHSSAATRSASADRTIIRCLPIPASAAFMKRLLAS